MKPNINNIQQGSVREGEKVSFVKHLLCVRTVLGTFIFSSIFSCHSHRDIFYRSLLFFFFFEFLAALGLHCCTWAFSGCGE